MRVIYAECAGEIWRQVARLAAEHHGWQPVYWTAAPEDIAAIRRQFPDAIAHAGVEAARAIPPPEAAGWPLPALGADLLQTMAVHESITLQMMDRMDPEGRSFSHEERRRHYYDLLRYWLAVLERLRPDLIVHSISPHIVYDYVLYALARAKGIATVMLDRHGLPGWVFATRGIDEPAVGLAEQLARPCGTALSPPFQAFLEASCEGGRGAVPANFQKKLRRHGLSRSSPTSHVSLWRAFAFELHRTAYLLKQHGLRSVERTYAKLPNKRPAESRPNALQLGILRLGAQSAKRRLRRHLARLAKPATNGIPYVLLALHYQPERATLPMGGAFGDQTLIVDLLAKAMPKGWELWVKEHPWQLQPFSRGETQRSDEFYERIARNPNVRLLPEHVEAAELIDAARAVATITGSIGWQALCREIPVLVFGAAWYRACPGAFPVRSPIDAEKAISAVSNGFRVEAYAVKRFLAAVQEVCVPGFLEPAVEDIAGLSIDAAAPAMAGLLAKSAPAPVQSR